MITAETLAIDAHEANLATYDTEGADGNVFVELVPDTPDLAVSIVSFGGTHDFAVGETVTEFQVRVRGEAGNPMAAQQLALGLGHHWRTNGFGAPSVWAEGTDAEATVIYAQPTVPYLMGWDENGRPEFVFRIRIRHAN